MNKTLVIMLLPCVWTLSPTEAGSAFARTPPSGKADPDVLRQPVKFRNTDIELSGVLLLPAGSQQVPAVVFTHGSGPERAEAPYPVEHAREMVRRLGMAVLLYDKRGVGGSGGDWMSASFTDLADDALAGMAFLKSHARIKSNRIGIWGQSQGASWVVANAAARSKDIAFVIGLAPHVGTPLEQERYNLRGKLRKAGLSKQQAQGPLIFFDSVVRLMRDGKKEEVASLVREASSQPWFAGMGGERMAANLTDERQAAFWRLTGDYDSRPDWAKVKCPTLLVLGKADELVDTRQSVKRLKAIKTGAKRKNIRIKVYPAPAGHVIGGKETPGYFDRLESWFKRRVEKKT